MTFFNIQYVEMKEKHCLEIGRIMDEVDKLDIRVNNSMEAIYTNVGNKIVNVWATKDNYPPRKIWEEQMKNVVRGTFARPCEFVGAMTWDVDDKDLVLVIGTCLYPSTKMDIKDEVLLKNNPVDIRWVRDQAIVLYKRAKLNIPRRIKVNRE